jgi:predicted nucleotidyltransferase
MKPADPNLEMIRAVADHLGPLREKVVFVGGATAGLLITDAAAPLPRRTKDVDLIVAIASLVQYTTVLRDQLLDLGFTEDTVEGAPVCRWLIAGVKVDIMPTGENVLGFKNHWFGLALRHAAEHQLDGGPTIRVVTAPFFLAMKLAAFDDRGQGDYQASHDIEDIVAVVDGRAGLETEVAAAPPELQRYLAEKIGALLDSPDPRETLSGHLPGDAASQARVPVLLRRLGVLAGRPR